MNGKGESVRWNIVSPMDSQLGIELVFQEGQEEIKTDKVGGETHMA